MVFMLLTFFHLTLSSYTVQFWTCGNYHWYLKQQYNLNRSTSNKPLLMWDAEEPMRIHIVNGLDYIQLNFCYTVHQSLGGNENNAATVAVCVKAFFRCFLSLHPLFSLVSRSNGVLRFWFNSILLQYFSGVYSVFRYSP